MSKKRDYVRDTIYSNFMSTHPYRNNPTDNEQSVIENMYIRILSEMCISRFKWIGLPKEINERFLELTLFRNALSVFYYDYDYEKFLALRGSGMGPLNMYDEPTEFRVVGNSSFVGKTLTDAECVPIWANNLRSPDTDIVVLYAKRLAHIDRTIDINSRNARRSKVVVADENLRLSATNINNQIDTGQPVVWVNSVGRDLISEMTAVDMGVNPDSIEKLQLTRTRLWNDCMGLLGLNHSNQDKRERLVADEVHANDEQIQNMRAVNLNERKRAIVEINSRYNMSIDVKYNVDLPTITSNTFGLL